MDVGSKQQIGASDSASMLAPFFKANSAFEYWVDAWQRSILLLDVMRQRGNAYVEHSARKAPHVLSFDFELLSTGACFLGP
jgi:hypothetical protein